MRAAINNANFLLVSGVRADGTPDGVSPDIARHIAGTLGVSCEFVMFDGPGQLADAVENDIWDIGNIAIEPARAEKIYFSNPYVQIDANFLVRRDAPFLDNESIDNVGVSIAAYGRSAYDLWLSENLSSAKIVRYESIEQSHEMFRQGKTDVLAGLKPKLLNDMTAHDGYRIIEPPFTGIQQAVGIAKYGPADSEFGKLRQGAVDFVNTLISEVIDDGTMYSLLKTHGVEHNLSIPA